MKITLQFILALVFACVAAGLNWFYLNLKTSPETKEFVVITEEVKPGDRIKPDQVGSYKMIQTDDNEAIQDSSLIPFGKREILFNMKATRNYQPGDFVLFQDLKKSGPPEYDALGPFRLLSVGDQLTSQLANETGSGNTLTLAVQEEFDETTRRLIQILQVRKESDLDSDSLYRLVGIQVHPRSTSPTTGPQPKMLELQPGEVAIFVDISDVDAIPSILAAGDQISFIIPKRPSMNGSQGD